MPIGTYYAIDRTAQHDARTPSKGATAPPGKDRLTLRRKPAIKAPASRYVPYNIRDLGGCIRPQGGEDHEGTMADAQREWVVARRGALCAGIVRMDMPARH